MSIPDEFTARSACDLTKNLSLFVQYARSTDAFHIEERGSERLFYELECINRGIRWITKWFDASVGGGCAFDQRFSHGYDIRDLTRVSRLEDVPFLALKLQGTF